MVLGCMTTSPPAVIERPLFLHDDSMRKLTEGEDELCEQWMRAIRDSIEAN